jgi:flagellar basal body-associated protein FliL
MKRKALIFTLIVVGLVVAATSAAFVLGINSAGSAWKW